MDQFSRRSRSQLPSASRPIIPSWQAGVPTTRRRFLTLSAASLSGVFLANCARQIGQSPEGQSAIGSGQSSGSGDGLAVYSWANYSDQELVASFGEQTGIKAQVDTYDSNETMLAKIQAGGGQNYSILFPSDYMVTEMLALDLLQPLDLAKLQGLETLMVQWKDPIYDPGNRHSIPATWGTTGFIYDPERLGFEIKSWDDLFTNQDKLANKVTLINDVREVLGSMLKAQGNSLNATDLAQVKAAYEKLLAFKPAVANFITNGWEDQLASGDVLVAMAYSSDAQVLISEQPNLVYAVPESGSSVWTDTIVIPKTAPNPEAAYAWINFFLNPKNAVDLVTRLRFATPNQATYELLPADLKDNRTLFPAPEVLAKCEGIAPLPAEVAEAYDQYWTQLTSA
jgi:spermidine/putrescine transport system substrate-binding protein